MSKSISQWSNESQNQWTHESLNQWCSEALVQRINQPVSKLIDESLNQWFSEAMNQWVNDIEPMSEPMNQWTREPMKQWIHESVKQGSNEPMNERVRGWPGGWASYSSVLSYFFTEWWGTSSPSYFFSATYLGHFCSELLPSWLFCSFCNPSFPFAQLSSCNTTERKSSTMVKNDFFAQLLHCV